MPTFHAKVASPPVRNSRPASPWSPWSSRHNPCNDGSSALAALPFTTPPLPSMPSTESPLRVAIIGGGASGTLVAAQIMRQARQPVQLVLIERSAELGGGVAYAASSVAHRLNTPAHEMSAWPGEQEHFTRWLETRLHSGNGIAADPFPLRVLVGEYLRDVLAAERGRAAATTDFTTVRAEVVDLEPLSHGVRLLCRDGRTLDADRVVLAVGNLPGEYPVPRPLPVYRDSRYVHVPWAGNPLLGLAPDDDVLLVGQGAIAVDLIVQLEAAGHRGTVHWLSRQGLRPKAHRPVATHALGFDPLAMRTVRALVRRVREEIAAVEDAGGNWRSVIDALRQQAAAVWQHWTWEQRARFLRHVRPLWEAHRHRFAPATLAPIERRLAAGTLNLHQGRLQVLEADATGLNALFRRRGSIQHVELKVARVINCTDSRTDYSKYQHPLFVHLLARGLIDHDPLALGINASAQGEVLRYHGEALPWFFTLGTPLKGMRWETTAFAEIAQQAQEVAAQLLLPAATARDEITAEADSKTASPS